MYEQNKVRLFATDKGDGIGFRNHGISCTVDRFGNVEQRKHLKKRTVYGCYPLSDSTISSRRDIRVGDSYIVHYGSLPYFMKCSDLNLFTTCFIGCRLDGKGETAQMEFEYAQLDSMIADGQIRRAAMER